MKIPEKEKSRHIIGYIIGFSIFILAIPAIIYSIPRIEHGFFSRPIINSAIILLFPATILFLIGLIFTIWSNYDLFKKGRGGPTDVFNIEISPRSKKLVVTGPYRYTRNPMVFGVNSMYFAIALMVNSLASLFFCSSFLIIIIVYLKQTEEKRLLKDFGDEYYNYKERTPMIIPFTK